MLILVILMNLAQLVIWVNLLDKLYSEIQNLNMVDLVNLVNLMILLI